MSAGTWAAYDVLPIGAIALRKGRTVYANPAGRSLLGVVPDAPDPAAGAHPAARLLSEVVAHPSTDLWLRFDSPEGTRSIHAWKVPGQAPEEQVILLQEAEGERRTQRLVDALVRAAGLFVKCRQPAEILDAAADALHQQGYLVATLLIEGEMFVHGPMRHNEESLALGRELFGMPVEEVRIPLSKGPGMPQMLQTGRAVFHEDMHAVADAIHPPEVAQMIRRVLPPMTGLSAPIFVEGRPFGILSVQGAISPGNAATVELFANLIGSALENLQHQRRADDQRVALNELQQVLVERERLAAVGQAAGVLSHEARNPLGAILNAIAVLRRQRELGADGREILNIAEEEALRLDALVRDLLELARPLEPRLRELDVAELASAALDRWRSRPGAPPGEVQFRSAGPCVAKADPILLRLALENLLRNAAQSGAGAPISLELSREEGTVVLAVAEGAGTDAAAVEVEFDPFSLMRPRGTGLGLAVVKRVVEAQGGTVRALRGGSRLELVLPAG